jgi:hypothetical protein
MQVFIQTVLAILLAHLTADFPLQTDSVMRAKKNGLPGHLVHGAIHLLMVIIALQLFTNVSIWSWYPLLLLVGYVALHLVLDYLKQAYMKARHLQDSTGPFVVDQALHVLMGAVLAWAITRVTWQCLITAAHWSDDLRRHILLLAVTYTAVIFAGGYLVRSMTRSLTEDMPTPEGEDKAALRNAGLYIGWLERLLVLTAFLIQSPAMIGLILTGKSIARLGELKGPKFAEYFLIGTLLSVSLALGGGVFLMLALYGSVVRR